MGLLRNLCIGDWVMYYDDYVKVKSIINYDTIIVEDYRGEVQSAHVIDLYPIQLTDKILEKIFEFNKLHDRYIYRRVENYHLEYNSIENMLTITYQPEILNPRSGYVKYRNEIRYVHELQQALRILKIDMYKYRELYSLTFVNLD